jgi:hypothetical protein
MFIITTRKVTNSNNLPDLTQQVAHGRFVFVLLLAACLCTGAGLDVKERAVAQIRDQPEVEGRRSGGLAT